MVATAVGIAREEGFFKLWQGISPALYRHVVYRYVLLNFDDDDDSKWHYPPQPLRIRALSSLPVQKKNSKVLLVHKSPPGPKKSLPGPK